MTHTADASDKAFLHAAPVAVWTNVRRYEPEIVREAPPGRTDLPARHTKLPLNCIREGDI